MNFCVRARPVAGAYSSARARLTSPSSERGSRGTSMGVVFLGPAPPPKIRHSQLKGEEEEAARGIVVNENASVWRTSAEIDVKGK